MPGPALLSPTSVVEHALEPPPPVPQADDVLTPVPQPKYARTGPGPRHLEGVPEQRAQMFKHLPVPPPPPLEAAAAKPGASPEWEVLALDGTTRPMSS